MMCLAWDSGSHSGYLIHNPSLPRLMTSRIVGAMSLVTPLSLPGVAFLISLRTHFLYIDRQILPKMFSKDGRV